MKAEEGRGNGRGGKKSGGGGLKKGSWTPAEDAILMEHVRKHGEGNWNEVQRQSGLARCGKSCRLRWVNHLHPNLKKGSFTPDEELLILRLHAQLGNKWARMAAQLPGRTDNEIKNYWNTRLKRRQRAGLPIYPPEMKDSVQRQAPTTPAVDCNGDQLPYLRPAPLLDAAGLFPPRVTALPPLLQNSFNCQIGYPFPPSPVSPASTPASLFRPPQQLGLMGHDFGPPPSLPFAEKVELPSSQLFLEPVAGDRSRLPEALLQDAFLVDDMKVGDLLAHPVAGHQNAIWEQLMSSGVGCESEGWEEVKHACHDFSFGSIPQLEEVFDCNTAHVGGTKFNDEGPGDTDIVEDDLSTLLGIPMQAIPMIPDWCNTNGSADFSTGNEQSPVMASDQMGLGIPQLASSLSIASTEQDWNISSWPWNNMPGIC